MRADGTVQYLHWENLLWKAADGTVGGIVIFTEDTTQLRATEEEVRRRNAELNSGVELARRNSPWPGRRRIGEPGQERVPSPT